MRKLIKKILKEVNESNDFEWIENINPPFFDGMRFKLNPKTI